MVRTTKQRGMAWAGACIAAAGIVASSTRAQTAGPVEVKAVLPDDTYYLGQVFTCYLVVDGTHDAALGKMPDAETDAVRARFVGARPSVESGRKRITLTLECVPLRAGEIMFPALELKVDGSDRFSQPIPMVVKAPVESDKIQLKVSLSETSCYVGQPVVMTFTWESRLFIGGFRAVDIHVPAFSDSRVRIHEPLDKIDANASNAIGVPVDQRRVIAELEEKKVGEEPFSTIRFKKVVVPRTAGTLTLPPAALLCSYLPPKDQRFSGFRYPSYFNNDFFEGKVSANHERFFARSGSLTLEVRALPAEGRPEDFGGVVGKFTLAAEAEPRVVAELDPITLTLRLQGHPFPQVLETPDLRRQSALAFGFDVPDEPAKSSLQGGERIFTQVIRPAHAKVLAIPAVRLWYFDPATASYGEAASEPIPVTVSSAPKADAFDAVFSDGSRLQNEIARSAVGIHGNYPVEELLEPGRPVGWMGERPWFWLTLLLGPPALCGLLFVGSRNWRFARQHPEEARAREAYRRFRRRVQPLRFEGGEQDESGQVDALRYAVQVYFADRFGLRRGASSSEELVRLLQAREVDPPLIAPLVEFWDRAACALFSPRGSNGNSPRAVAAEIPEVIESIEKCLRG